MTILGRILRRLIPVLALISPVAYAIEQVPQEPPPADEFTDRLFGSRLADPNPEVSKGAVSPIWAPGSQNCSPGFGDSSPTCRTATARSRLGSSIFSSVNSRSSVRGPR